MPSLDPVLDVKATLISPSEVPLLKENVDTPVNITLLESSISVPSITQAQPESEEALTGKSKRDRRYN